MAEVLMPQLGETVVAGTVTRWLKHPGDRVEVDDPLFEVSTDKVDTDVPSAVSGVLSSILVAEGETVPVGTLLAVIATAEAAWSAMPPSPAVAPLPSPQPAPGPVTTPTSASSIPTPAVAAAANPAAALLATDPVPVTPVVRRLLGEHALDPSEVTPTGSHGRITRADVERAAARRAVASSGATPPTPSPEPPPTPHTAQAAEPSNVGASSPPRNQPLPTVRHRIEIGPGDEVLALSPTRRAIAANLTASLHATAHTQVGHEADYSGVDAARGRHEQRFRQQTGVGLTYLPFVARAVIEALRDWPRMNASLGPDPHEPETLVVHRRVNLGISVDRHHEGLVVPVLHHADGLRLGALAADLADLAKGARAGTLPATAYHGGTITITNAGAAGTSMSVPVIPLPQVAILSIDGIGPRPVAVPDGAGGWGVGIRPTGNLSLTFDHRAIDGAYAAGFLAAVAGQLATRAWEVELS